MNKCHEQRILSVVAAAVLALAGSGAAADPVSDFYKGKTLKVIVGSGEGGGFGLNGRILGQHIAKHIPGNPTVIMQFMQGGGGVKAANFVANIAPKDGSVISMPISSIVEDQLLRPKGVRFDGAKFKWLGSVTSLASVLSVWHTSPVKSIEAAKTTQIVLGSPSGSSSWYRMVKLMNPLLGTKFKIISGYKGSRDVDLAMERGEIQGRAMVWASTKANRGHWLKAGKLVHLVQIGPYKLADLPDVPRFIDLVKTDKEKSIVQFLQLTGLIGRALHTPPMVPEDRVTALRHAFDATMKDPAYVAELKKRGLPLGPTKGTDLQSFIEKVIATPASTLDAINRELL